MPPASALAVVPAVHAVLVAAQRAGLVDARASRDDSHVRRGNLSALHRGAFPDEIHRLHALAHAERVRPLPAELALRVVLLAALARLRFRLRPDVILPVEAEAGRVAHATGERGVSS